MTQVLTPIDSESPLVGAALAALAAALPLPPGAVLSATGLRLPPGVPFGEWEALVEALEADIMGAAIRGQVGLWALGDAINYGERYGETYAQALLDTGRSYGGLANIAWVARKVESSRRRENLSFEHHRAVAPLEPREQERWLREANHREMSTRDLRDAIQAQRDADDGLDPLQARALRACDRAAEAVAALDPDRWIDCIMRIVNQLRGPTMTPAYAWFLRALETELHDY